MEIDQHEIPFYVMTMLMELQLKDNSQKDYLLSKQEAHTS